MLSIKVSVCDNAAIGRAAGGEGDRVRKLSLNMLCPLVIPIRGTEYGGYSEES